MKFNIRRALHIVGAALLLALAWVAAAHAQPSVGEILCYTPTAITSDGFDSLTAGDGSIQYTRSVGSRLTTELCIANLGAVSDKQFYRVVIQCNDEQGSFAYYGVATWVSYLDGVWSWVDEKTQYKYVATLHCSAEGN